MNPNPRPCAVEPALDASAPTAKPSVACVPKNPNRSEAGKRNRAQRGPLTPEGRERLRAAALRHQPWQHATGPQTPAGKQQAARNGKRRQSGPLSVREVRAALADVKGLAEAMRAARREAQATADVAYL